MKLVVVGGGAAGMSCAARARRLDEAAEITVLEKTDYVSYASCGLPYFVGGEIAEEQSLLVQTPASLRASLNLDVRIRHCVTALDRAARRLTVATPDGDIAIDYDALVLAPGAEPLRPPLPGLDSPRVQTLRTVPEARALREQATGGAARAVVLGAGFIGLEAAEALARRGLAVTVVELAPHVLPPLEEELAALVTAELTRLGIQVVAGVAATGVEPGAAADTVTLADGRRLPADLILLSVGVRPDTAPFIAAGLKAERGALVVDAHGRTSDPAIWAAGDGVLSRDAVTGALRPIPLAGPANRNGRLVADAILRPATARPLPAGLGTAIVRVGDLTVALTGANRASLAAAGLECHTLHLHPAHHAGYFPGAQPLHVVVHVDATGTLLGAQVVGGPGADRRVDVLATAIRAGWSVADLIDLDLCYSPPYGSAKDPVTMVGLVGDNVVNGQLTLWYAQDVDAVLNDCLLLDVRSPAEFAAGHLPGALNIPHTELRDRLDEVTAAAAGRPVRTMCGVGLRSYIAHLILVAAGFDSASLSGGAETLHATLAARGRSDLLVTESN
ncbi:MAG: FAD-dependent oxidoreductase [Propionibacteriaceae bacterium]|jgi:NADPH-dependent 2,4-dienoyl-CoA reductase/sulfur reductase-like enzyme/rhodanese-related sulfurtransferase|nr:FAD-dependent oxidoreductase [Propionibacteriaceae bacterium]